MTKFISLQNQKCTVKPTVFTHCITTAFTITETTDDSPDDYYMVIHIGYDPDAYGDVFKAIRYGESADFALYFGKKGDENYEPIQ